MTLREEMKSRLVACGMFAAQADEVLRLAREDQALESVLQRWDDSVGDYPAVLLQTVWVSVMAVALDWIDVTVPKAWYRNMFV